MSPVLMACFAAIRASVHARAELEAEILALRHQLAVLQRAAPKRPHLSRTDRLLWVLLSRTELTQEALEVLPTTRDGLKAFLGQVPGARPNLEVGGLTGGVGFRIYG